MAGVEQIFVGALTVLTSTAAAVGDDAPFADLEQNLTRHIRDRYSADLEEVKERGVLRVLTRNNSSSYFITRGTQRGFDFELAEAFARELGVRIAVSVPSSRATLIEELLSGAGDLIAAGMTRTEARSEKVRFTRAVLSAPRVIATHPLTVKPVFEPEDLEAFLIHTSFRSTTYRTALAFEERTGVDLRLADVVDGVEMEQQLRRVDEGTYEAVIVDEAILDLGRASGLSVEARWPVSDPLPKAWAVHPDASDLQAAADAFLQRAERRGLLRIYYGRYYRPHALGFRRASEEEFRLDRDGAISPYDELFKKAGEATGIDWRLLAAVSYAETRFDASARSPWGAVGLMQVLPSTARRVGITKPHTPWGSVIAGARYLRRLFEFFEEEGVDKRQRVRFALAAYNAGLGHVQDARKLARASGRDPNRWFGHVEEALRLKTDPRYYEHTRHGYARAPETIAYVSRVQSQYDVFVRHVPLSTGDGAEPGRDSEPAPEVTSKR